MDDMNWRKSSCSSGNGGECVEVASPEGAVAVRDTRQNGTGPVLRFTPAAWHRFADQVKRSLASDLDLGRDAAAGTGPGAWHPSRSAQIPVRGAAGQLLRPTGPRGRA
jgi:hypothetical protein